MTDIEIKISKETRMVYLNKYTIGNDNENLQGNLIFTFKDEFVDGTARLEYAIKGQKYLQILTKEDEKYNIPIKSVLTKQGEILMQLVIVEPSEDDEEIPIFKSNIFKVYCNESINAQQEQPEEYPTWIEIISTKLASVDEAIEQTNNLNLDATRVEDGVEITITDKTGEPHTTKVNDGETGPQGLQGLQGPQGEKGEDAKINGYNTITINSGTNIEVEQVGNTLRINNTYDDSTILQNIETLNNAVEEHDQAIQNIENDIEELQGDVEDIGTEIDTIDSKIPNEATAQNQLADKNFVNSSIATNTAYFRGTYESTSELPLTGNTPNDYAFVIIYDEVITTQVKQYDRYKWNSTQWVYEYTLNNSSFTAQQWAAINSGITSGLVEKLNGIDLTNYVKNTDYATGGTAGVFKTASSFNTSVSSTSGILYALSSTYQQYQNKDTGTFISKGTLENVITGKGILAKKVVEIGSYQYTYDSYVLPAIDVSILRQVYADDKAGIPQILHWTLYGSENNLKIVSGDEIAGEYSIDILVHNKYHCEYKWNSTTTGIVNPTIQNNNKIEVIKVQGTAQTITNKEVDLDVPTRDQIDNIVSKATATTQNDGEMLTIDDALEYRTFDKVVDGNYKQETTTGKNRLAPNNLSTRTINGVTFTPVYNENGTLAYIEANGTATELISYDVSTIPMILEAGTYMLSGCPSGGGSSTYELGLRYASYPQDFGSGKSVTLSAEATYINCRIVIQNGVTVNNIKFYPMVEKNDVVTSYEPYTGGQPSPSPDYPQDIEVIEGYNLFDKISATNNQDNYILQSDGIITCNKIWGLDGRKYFNDMQLSEGTYTISFIPSTTGGNGVRFSLRNVDNSTDIINENRVITQNVKSTYTFTLENDTTLAICIMPNQASDGTLTLKDIQLEEGTRPRPYLPYGNIGIKKTGKNLIGQENINSLSSATGTYNGNTLTFTSTGTYKKVEWFIPVKVGDKFTFSCGGNETLYLGIFEYSQISTNASDRLRAIEWDNNITTNGQTSSFTIQNNGYLRVYLGNTSAITTTIENIMLEKGLSKTNYELYNSKTTYIDLQGNEVCKIGNVVDKLRYSNGHIYLDKYIGKVVLDGSEEINGNGSSETYGEYFLTIQNKQNGQLNMKSNYFITSSNDNDINRIFGRDTNNNLYFHVGLDVIPYSITDFKSWLSTHNTEVYYVLAEPYEVNLGNIGEINTYKGINNIEVITNLGTTFSIEYAQDLQKKIQNLIDRVTLLE